MSIFTVLVALFVEALLPRRVVSSWRRSLQRVSNELLVDLTALGLPSLRKLQWWLPVLIWLFLTWLIYCWLDGVAGLLGILFSIALLCLGLRYSTLVQVLTSLQVYLNQGDLYRSRETLLNWAKGYGLPSPNLKTEREILLHAIEHATERVLRQFFALLFWFVVVPGPMGVVFYLTVWWSVWRERDWHQTHEMASERLTLHQEWEICPRSAACSPRFVLYLLEWLPSRLFALSLLHRLVWADALEAWRLAASHTPMSNRSRVVALIHQGLQLDGENTVNVEKLVEFRVWVSQAALIWLGGIALLSLCGFLPA